MDLNLVPNSSAGAFNNSPRDYSSSNGRALPGFPALPVIDLDKTTSSSGTFIAFSYYLAKNLRF